MRFDLHKIAEYDNDIRTILSKMVDYYIENTKGCIDPVIKDTLYYYGVLVGTPIKPENKTTLDLTQLPTEIVEKYYNVCQKILK